MPEIATAEVIIDHGLRFVLLGLECAFDVPLSVRECERVFRDAETDQVSPKQYDFYSSPSLRISGRVEEYEPETLRLSVEGRRGCETVLVRVVESARHAQIRFQQYPQPGDAEPGVGADSR